MSDIMNETFTIASSKLTMNGIEGNVESRPDRGLLDPSSPVSYTSPESRGKVSHSEDTSCHPVETSSIRQSTRKRRIREAEPDPKSSQGVDHSDSTVKIDFDGISVLTDEVNGGGSSSHSSRKRRTRSPILPVSSNPSVATCVNDETQVRRRSSLRNSNVIDASSSTIEYGECSEKVGATRQSTRSRTQRVTYESEFNQITSRKEETTNEEESEINTESLGDDEMSSIDALASALAVLDTRAYHRALVCDSSGLFQRIVQPLSLPWMHRGPPIARNTAFDIDDMTETLTADDGSFTPHSSGPLGFGRYDIGQLRRGSSNTRLATSWDSVCSASRRSTDPGILEVSSITLPLSFSPNASHSTVPEAKRDLKATGVFRDTDGAVNAPAGEISLQCFERNAQTRRSRVAKVKICAKQRLISVRVGSSSSRSSIFTDIKLDTESRYGKMLQATLPPEVQNGKVLNAVNAQKVAESLGSYDSRHGFPKTTSAGRSQRIGCGRTRLVWTDRRGPADQPQKVIHSSLLCGERLEQGSHKRPRDVTVTIRVAGAVFGGRPVADDQTLGLRSQARLGFANAECTLDDDELVKSILADTHKASTDRNKARTRVVSAFPVLDCLPDSNGAIGVVCTVPGKIPWSSVHERLNHAAKLSSVRSCTVCWSPDHDQSYVVQECAECGTLAHTQCCYDSGKIEDIHSIDDSSTKLSWWRCAVCCFKKSQPSVVVTKSNSAPTEQSSRSRRKPKLPQGLRDFHIDDTLPAGRPDHIQGEIASHGIKCALCPYHGGAMSRVKSGKDFVWMHEVCRLWRSGVVDCTSDIQESKFKCALCGKTEKRRMSSNGSSEELSSENRGYLIKCASSRCQVYFHPMCALLSSKMNEFESITPSPGQFHPFTDQGIDQGLCAAFSLSAMNCEVARGDTGEYGIHSTTIRIPIGFCGIHNPNRSPTSRGLYPAGKHMNNDTIQIPAFDGTS